MTTLAVINPSRKGKKRAKRKGNPVAKKAKRVKVKVRRAKSGAVTIRATNPKKRRRRNPAGLSGAALTKAIMPALTGAAGALVIDKALDMFGGYLPVSLRTGWARYATLAGAALAIGFALDKAKLLNPQTRTALVGGALTVTAYKAISDQIMPMIAPTVALAPPPAASTVKGFQPASLLGYQEAQLLGLGDMTNSGMAVGTYV